MDTYRGNFVDRDYGDETPDYDFGEEEIVRETPPSPVGQDERRMQVRAYNHWASLLDNRNFPSIEDLDPESLPDFGPYSVLLDFTAGIENPAVHYLGNKLAQECGATDSIETLDDVPSRSLLSRITDHYMQILANQAPIGFEAEFVNQREKTILYRGILLPFSSDDDTIDFIYGVINWKEIADQQATDELLLEVDQALEGPAMIEPRADVMLPDWADGPADGNVLDLGQFGQDAGEPMELPEPGFASFGEQDAGFDASEADESEAVYEGEDEDEGEDEGEGEESSLGLAALTGGFSPEPLFPPKKKALAVPPPSADEYELQSEAYQADTVAPAPVLHDNPPLELSVLAPEAQADAPTVPVADLASSSDMGLADWLASARELAEAAHGSEDRSRQALYAAIGRAYDFSIAAAAEPEEYAELLADSGLSAQERAPLLPVVKLVFGIDYDKTRLTEYATALGHAHRIGLERGALSGYLAAAQGGLKGVITEERRLRQGETAKPAARTEMRPGLARALRKLEVYPFDAVPAEGSEFTLLVARRLPSGEVVLLGEVADDVALIEKAARKLVAD